ncbi:hypothetical protein AO383_1539 [Moraxella catarrhalis]|nr:hypothetical protein AO383_1539 [Moraxella catarrhalis]
MIILSGNVFMIPKSWALPCKWLKAQTFDINYVFSDDYLKFSLK